MKYIKWDTHGVGQTHGLTYGLGHIGSGIRTGSRTNTRSEIYAQKWTQMIGDTPRSKRTWDETLIE